MEEIFIFMIGLSIIIGLIFIYSSNQNNKKTEKGIYEKLKKISLTNYLLISINILLIVVIYQMIEIKKDIPENFGGYSYLERIDDKLNKINSNLNNIDYTLYKSL